MTRKLLFSLLLAIVVVGPTFAQRTKTPHFSSYPAQVWRGKRASLNLRSHPYARKFRTTMREQLKELGVNFAGHYTIAAAGCGTGCSVTGIIDNRTGDAYFPNEFDGWTAVVGDYDWKENEDVRTFRSDSRLLRVVGRPNIGNVGEEKFGPSGVYYYDWHGSKLRLVKFVPAGSYPEADP
jgi:hypothetical protein